MPLLLAAVPQFAGVQHYATDQLTSIDANKWIVSGAASAAASGVSAANATGGSLISRIPIPDGSSEAEVDMTVTLVKSGGIYTEFLQASADAHTSGTGGGSYLAFEMHDPTFDDNNNCLATFVVLQSVGGSVSVLASFQHGCRSGMQMRMAAHNGVVLVWPDQATPAELYTTLGSGQPGVGLYNTPVGNSISLVQLGSIARTPPAAVNSNLITSSAYRTSINLRWPAVSVAATSSGLNGYFIYRDGAYLTRTTKNFLIDEAVSPGATHTYTIYAVDQHFNQSSGASVTVTTPVPVSRH